MSEPWLLHPAFVERGIAHGFGTRSARPPAALRRPRQVHGAAIADAADCAAATPPEADGVVSTEVGIPVAVVTADCVPILLASDDAFAVAAVHAGWRGLAAGVVAAGLAALRSRVPDAAVSAAIGPCVGPCCYEVDTPVLDALRRRFGADLDAASTPTRPGHARIDLAAIARADLESAGLGRAAIGSFRDTCTVCDPLRFHSYRRDGPGAGRLVHFIAAGARQS